MLTINDDRVNNKRFLFNLEPDAFFIWNELVFRRVQYMGDIEVRKNKEVLTDDIVVMLMRTGELTTIRRDAMVEPITCELMIME